MSQLDDIQRRADNPFETSRLGIGRLDADRDVLLALVREQQARIERVEAQLNEWSSFKPFPDAEESQRWYSLGKRHAADSIRAALDSKP